MIQSKFAGEQIDRLSGLSFFPKPVKGDTQAQAAYKELRLALECAATDAIGKLVVDDWLKTNADAPKPAELRGLVWVENERLERREADKFKPPPARVAHCSQCQDFGIVESITADEIRSIACYCDCPAGREQQSQKPVERINAARRKLIASENKGRITPVKAGDVRHVADVYRGEF